MACDDKTSPGDIKREVNYGCHSQCQNPNKHLYGDLCTKFKSLYHRWRRNQPRRRIQELAVPKYRRSPYRPKVCKPINRKVEIVRDTPTLSTRAEQLAYCPVRKLIANRDSMGGSVPLVLHERLNKYIYRGMYSMYARLANTTPPVISNPIKPWTKDEWEQHTIKLRKLATPKTVPALMPIERKSKPLAAVDERLEFLATPRAIPKKERPKPDVNPAALTYEATERVLELSKPKPSRELPPRLLRRFRGKKYEASGRTKELARHREKKTAVSDTRENPFQVPPNALKARASERVKTLANPKEYSKVEPRDPMKISPAALKAKPSKRIIEMAQSKNKVDVAG